MRRAAKKSCKEKNLRKNNFNLTKSKIIIGLMIGYLAQLEEYERAVIE